SFTISSSRIHLHSLSFHLSFFFNHPPTPEIYTLSLHDALPISTWCGTTGSTTICSAMTPRHSTCSPGTRIPLTFRLRTSNDGGRSEEHTSELQSQSNLVCRLLLEKKKKKNIKKTDEKK